MNTWYFRCCSLELFDCIFSLIPWIGERKLLKLIRRFHHLTVISRLAKSLRTSLTSGNPDVAGATSSVSEGSSCQAVGQTVRVWK